VPPQRRARRERPGAQAATLQRHPAGRRARAAAGRLDGLMLQRRGRACARPASCNVRTKSTTRTESGPLRTKRRCTPSLTAPRAAPLRGAWSRAAPQRPRRCASGGAEAHRSTRSPTKTRRRPSAWLPAPSYPSRSRSANSAPACRPHPVSTGEGRGMSSKYEGRDEACPVSTRGGTRLVQLVREGRGRGAA